MQSEDRDRSRKRDRDRSRSRERAKSKKSEKDRDKSREREKTKENKDRDKSRSHKDKKREKSHSKERSSRDSKDRRDRDRDRDRERDRDRDRSDKRKRRSKSRERSRSRSKSAGRKRRRDEGKEDAAKVDPAAAARALAAKLSAQILQRVEGGGVATQGEAGAPEPPPPPPASEAAQAVNPMVLEMAQQLQKRLSQEAQGMAPMEDVVTSTVVASSTAALDLSQAEAEIRRRQERVRQFQEERRRQDAAMLSSASTRTTTGKWSLEDEGDEDDAAAKAQAIAARMSAAMETPSPAVQTPYSSVPTETPAPMAEDMDPLDAFMKTLEREGDPVTQADMYSAFGAGDPERQNGFNPAGTTITMDEILGRAKSNKAGWESDTDVDDYNDDDEDEERLEQDRIAFLEALKAKRMEEEGQPLVKSEVEEGSVAPPAEEKKAVERIFAGDGDIMEEHERATGQQKSSLELLQEQIKKKELKQVDHSKMEYRSFRKKLYIVPRALALPEKDIQARRAALEIKVRGKGCPAPVENWQQTGLSDRILQLLAKHKMQEPFPIQKQALPAIMAGRDIIGVAKTGSGKTLAFILPMLRHILDQEANEPLRDGQGPIGLIMAPARELAVQIYTEAKKFAKPLGLRVACVYGGAGVKEQIADLKRGAHIVVCTPGRMIDILTMQAGKTMSLEFVTFVVMDEADRMFDMGFEPQIRMIIQNVRPDRQTVLFSATFPKQVETLARKVLSFPLEIIVGGRSVASDNITQYVEIHDDTEKFMRLLQLLGVWYEKGNVLIFVDTQQKCDSLFSDLIKSGYPCSSLHGGMDQLDRESTISDFKKLIKTLMVATSVAGRGLDVPELVCVINYSCPNHLEDYVHRVGRTGRAGRKGTAYTFLAPDEDQYAPILVKALEQSKQEVPEELRQIADEFEKKVKAGEARKASSGFGGKGFTFDESEKTEAQKAAAAQRRAYELEQGIITDEPDLVESDDEEAEPARPPGQVQAPALPAVPVAPAIPEPPPPPPEPAVPLHPDVEAAKLALQQKLVAEGLAPAAPTPDPAALERVKAIAAQFGIVGAPAPAPPSLQVPAPILPPVSGPVDPKTALERARMLADQLMGNQKKEPAEEHFEDELEINDYPQQARWKVTHRDTVREIQERTGCAIITRGLYCPTGKEPDGGERKLYLAIEGESDMSVRQAKRELQRVLDEETLRVGSRPNVGRYSVV